MIYRVKLKIANIFSYIQTFNYIWKNVVYKALLYYT